ncbi:MAG: (Fe-S)-binding protein, partial [Petrimonas sp.]|nr:(Fe-S)-binding protein [Petrimonas sp.]
ILNPGVIINDDKDVFIKNLKNIPSANPIIDKCIECGFCEVTCPSKNLTMTPRQRIVAYRYLKPKPISYSLDETCATDGLCGIACPVGIDTGTLVKELRWENVGKWGNFIAGSIAANMDKVSSTVRQLLKVPHTVARIIGYNRMENIARGLFKVGDGLFPLWTRYTPSGAAKIKQDIFPADPSASSASSGSPLVVYFPSCITRTMGTVPAQNEAGDTPAKMLSVLQKAGYTVIIPEGKESLCCGMAFSSKGFRKQAKKKESELNDALLEASRNGELPVVCDMSPCLLHMRETLDPRLKLYDQVEFIHDFLLDKLTFEKQPISIAIHTTCSSTKMHLEEKLKTVAELCAEKVIVPDDVYCCGWAGDRGFFYPELNNSALAPLKHGIGDATEGFSNSRTCEIGLSINSGVAYKSLVYLVDRAAEGR